MRNSFVCDILHTLNTRLGELCTSHYPYTNCALLIKECSVSDILHALITPYSSGRVVHLENVKYKIRPDEYLVYG
jgi:hypothetical protein